ncbi:MAG: DUF521 domain-containing protein [Candidatus Promineofilum sp.]|nr:DUF521 domain-containing protein [Promineifilum sp.]
MRGDNGMSNGRLQLNERDQAMLAGEMGEATRMAMRILVTMAGVYGADHLLDIESAHIDGCLYHGYSGLEFAERLVAGGAAVAVPTTLNVGAMDLINPDVFRGDAQLGQWATQLMQAYEAMGCRPTFTCAPYQAQHRPSFGTQIAWAESNAIVFANSVLGARTNRYGDFIDICCAITGRAPAMGLHLPENRAGQILFRLKDIPDRLLAEDVLFPVLGYWLGARVGTKIPVIEGLRPETTEDQLKIMGAAAASSGGVALFHAVGVTPEAPTLAAALQGHVPERVVEITLDDLKGTLAILSTAADGPIDVVALGSPHFSMTEFAQLLPLVERFPPRPGVEFIVCTDRLAQITLHRRGWLERLRAAGVQIVADTCILGTPIIRAQDGVLMTNSGKYAHYTPGSIGLQVVYGSLEECVRSAAAGEVWRDVTLWAGERGDARAEQQESGETKKQASTSEGYRLLVPGEATGPALVLDAPLSLWGGLDPVTGNIIDQRHPQWQANVTGKVLVMPVGRGSSSASSILLEAARRGTGPAAIVLAEPDAILALGAAVARELYGAAPPVLVIDSDAYARIRTGDEVTVSADGLTDSPLPA